MLVLGSIVFKNFEPFGTMATIKVHGMLNKSSINYFSDGMFEAQLPIKTK